MAAPLKLKSNRASLYRSGNKHKSNNQTVKACWTAVITMMDTYSRMMDTHYPMMDTYYQKHRKSVQHAAKKLVLIDYCYPSTMVIMGVQHGGNTHPYQLHINKGNSVLINQKNRAHKFYEKH